MLELIYLETNKFKMKTYVKVSIFSCILLIGFTYLMALIATVEKDPTFQNYTNIFKFIGIMHMIVFIVLSAVMYSRIVIEDYVGKRLILHFSYPVSRSKILLAKISLVTVFTLIAFLISNVLCLSIFSLTEWVSPILKATLTIYCIFTTLQNIVLTGLTIVALSILAMGIAFINKSMPTAIVSGFILAATIGNTIINVGGYVGYGMLSSLIIIDIVTVKILINRINKMDAI